MRTMAGRPMIVPLPLADLYLHIGWRVCMHGIQLLLVHGFSIPATSESMCHCPWPSHSIIHSFQGMHPINTLQLHLVFSTNSHLMIHFKYVLFAYHIVVFDADGQCQSYTTKSTIHLTLLCCIACSPHLSTHISLLLLISPKCFPIQKKLSCPGGFTCQ